MKSNSKEVRNNVKKHILECVTNYEGEQFATIEEAKQFAKERFDIEYNNEYNKKKYPNLQQRFKEYCLGMPFDFTSWYSEQKEILNFWGLFKDEATDKQTSELYYYLIFKEVFK